MTTLRQALYTSSFIGALLVAVAIVAYNMYGALALTPIPPGRMSVFTYIGLKDLQRGVASGEALKAPAMLAYLLSSLGLGEFAATRGAAILSLAALPFASGLYGFVATRSKLVGGASALLVSLIPFSYLSAIGGDYTFVSSLALVQLSLLFSFLLMKGSRPRLLPAWLVLSSATAALAGMDLESASVLLFVTALAWAAYSLLSKKPYRSLFVLIPGAVALLVNLLVAPPDPTEALRSISPISTLSQYQLLLVVLGVAGVAGGAALVYRARMEAVPLVSFVFAGLVLLPSFGAEPMLLVLPGMVALAMVPLREAKGMLASVREEGESGGEGVVVEVHFEKLVAFAFAVIMLTSPFVTGLGPGAAVQGTNYLGNEELQTIGQVQTLRPSVFGTGLVAAPSSIAPWLRAELGVNALLALSPDQAALADAITSTSFRLRGSYLMADEWTPFSSTRSPFIYAFDGSVYGAVLHLDDGTNRVNMSTPQGARAEDMSGTYLRSHGSSQNATAETLTMELTKVGFNVTKEISVDTAAPAMVVSYDVFPNGATPTSMTLPVYIEGAQSITCLVSGDSIQLSMASANLTLTFPGGSTPRLVQGGAQAYVISAFGAVNGEVRASVSVLVQSAKDSGEGAFYSSLLDAVRERGVSSLLTFAPEPGLSFLGSASGPQMTVDVKDAFNRVSYTENGTSYVESATNARVLSQSVSNSSCSAAFNYETNGIDIQKSVSASNDSVTMSYYVQPRTSGGTIEETNMTFWIPFQRSLLSYGMGNGSLTLRLDNGPVVITSASGAVKSIEVGPDPVYGQLRVVMTFTGGSAGATLAFGRQVTCREVLASRPVMNGTDELQLYVIGAPFQEVFSNQFFTIYEVLPTELPP